MPGALEAVDGRAESITVTFSVVLRLRLTERRERSLRTTNIVENLKPQGRALHAQRAAVEGNQLTQRRMESALVGAERHAPACPGQDVYRLDSALDGSAPPRQGR